MLIPGATKTDQGHLFDGSSNIKDQKRLTVLKRKIKKIKTRLDTQHSGQTESAAIDSDRLKFDKEESSVENGFNKTGQKAEKLPILTNNQDSEMNLSFSSTDISKGKCNLE